MVIIQYITFKENSEKIKARLKTMLTHQIQNEPEVVSSSEKIVSRRSFLQQSLTLPIALLIAACAGYGSSTGSAGTTTATPQATTGAQPTTRSPTSACSGTPTPSQTEGPYYKPGSPECTSLRESGLAGTPLTITRSEEHTSELQSQ